MIFVIKCECGHQAGDHGPLMGKDEVCWHRDGLVLCGCMAYVAGAMQPLDVLEEAWR